MIVCESDRPKVIKETIDYINNLSHEEMLELWRTACPGHPYLNMNGPYYKVFFKRFKTLGGLNYNGECNER